MEQESAVSLIKPASASHARHFSFVLAVLFVVALLGSVLIGAVAWHRTVKPVASQVAAEVSDASHRTVDAVNGFSSSMSQLGQDIGLLPSMQSMPKDINGWLQVVEDLSPISLFMRDAASLAQGNKSCPSAQEITDSLKSLSQRSLSGSISITPSIECSIKLK